MVWCDLRGYCLWKKYKSVTQDEYRRSHNGSGHYSRPAAVNESRDPDAAENL